MRHLIITGITLFTISFSSIAQQHLQFRAGIPFYSSFSEPSGDLELDMRVIPNWSFGLNYHIGMKNNLSLGIDFSAVKGHYLTNFPEIMGSKSSGGPSLVSYQLGPVLRKEFQVLGKFGFQASLGLLGNFLNKESQVYENDKSLQVIVISDTDQNGNVINRPLHNIVLIGEDKVQSRFNAMVRPELGLFLHTGQRSRLTLDAMYGMNLGNPVMIRDFSEINYDGQLYTAGSQLSGNYLAVMLGYQFQIR